MSDSLSRASARRLSSADSSGSSVASVALLPPTLIASLYGMNFQYMPELSQKWGYPFALGLMVLSAVVPMLYFRKRGWLK